MGHCQLSRAARRLWVAESGLPESGRAKYAPDFVNLTAVIGMLVSAVVGLSHIKAHRRIAAPKL